MSDNTAEDMFEEYEEGEGTEVPETPEEEKIRLKAEAAAEKAAAKIKADAAKEAAKVRAAADKKAKAEKAAADKEAEARRLAGIRDGNAFEKGTWQHDLVTSARLQDRSTGDRKKASSLLWKGAIEAVNEWIANSDVDVYAENLYAEVLDILGISRKGDVSKIKTVALAVKNSGLVLGNHANLSQAYGEANRLTKTVVQDRADDAAADEVIETIVESAPKTATTPESAALILLAKGVDGAVVAILDALNGVTGEFNEGAARSFLRAVTTEVASRISAAKPVSTPKAPAEAKTGATVAKNTASPKATPKSGADKPAQTKAMPAKKATPVSASKGDPNAKALPPKAVPVKR